MIDVCMLLLFRKKWDWEGYVADLREDEEDESEKRRSAISHFDEQYNVGRNCWSLNN